jgi:hypothetical protein
MASYMTKNRGLDQSSTPKANLATFLEETKPNMLNHFPREINLDNYKDICEQYFIEIGITEKLNESLQRIAKKLGFEYLDNVPLTNKTKRDEIVPYAFREKFIELNQLEYEVYNYCLKKFL